MIALFCIWRGWKCMFSYKIFKWCFIMAEFCGLESSHLYFDQQHSEYTSLLHFIRIHPSLNQYFCLFQFCPFRFRAVFITPPSLPTPSQLSVHEALIIIFLVINFEQLKFDRPCSASISNPSTICAKYLKIDKGSEK